MARYISIPRRCGIYYIPILDPSDYRPEETWIPLTQVITNARIINYSAHVTLTQIFSPPTSNKPNEKTPEAKYSFPVHPLSSVVSFVARIKHEDNVVKTIRGVVKSLPTAKKEYKKAVERGETAGFLEQVEDDVFTMKLGNIPQTKGTVVEVDVGYVTELKHDTEIDGIRFTIPTAIAPRYGSNTSGVSSTSGTHVKDGLEVNVEIDMPGPVTSVQSPSHPLAVTLGSLNASSSQDAEFDNKLAFAKLSQSKPYLEGDFILHILARDIAAPRAILEPQFGSDETIDSAALMLTFVPKFVLPPATGPKKIRKEIIFMIDRSGSMYDKIDPLKSAMKVFLKSLPPNDGVRFDICSFGSRFTFLFDDRGENKRGSRLYSQKTLKEALDHVENIDADYGGTEILEPIQETCERVLKRNKERTEKLAAGNAEEEDRAEWETEVLLLTDGEVWNTGPLFDLVRDHTQEWRRDGKRADGRAGVRVFTLGIGRDVSHGLVEGLARVGGGYSSTVGDNERFEGKVVRMLKAALGERVGGYTLTFDGMEDWGVSSNTSGTVTPDGDDFEMVDAPKEMANQPTTTPTPISLFDTSANPDATHEGSKPTPTPTLTPPVIVRTPHIIPPLFAFNRTTVYLLLTPRTSSAKLSLPKVVALKAVTSGGQPLELSIPVTKLTGSGKSVHQLATKKYLDDLKAGESWIHSARGSGKKLTCIYGEGENAKRGTVQLYKPDSDDYKEDEFEEIVKREGERIGVEWGVVGKWTAFVALEETSSGEKIVENEKPEQSSHKAESFPAGASSLVAGSVASFMSYVPIARNALSYSAVSRSKGMQSHPPISRAVISQAAIERQEEAEAEESDEDHGYGFDLAEVTTTPLKSRASKLKSRSSKVSEEMSYLPTSPSYSPISPVYSAHSYSAPPPPPPPSLPGYGSAPPPPSLAGYSSAPPPPAPPPLPAARYHSSSAFSAPSPSQKTPSQPTSNADATGRLIDLQEFEGYWNITNELISCFWSQSAKIAPNQVSVSSLKDQANKQLAVGNSLDQDLKERVLATALALVWFEHRLAGEKDTWELVVEKGRDWLSANVGGDVDKIFAKAKEVLKIA